VDEEKTFEGIVIGEEILSRKGMKVRMLLDIDWDGKQHNERLQLKN
jgi:hypothetical protein